MEQPQESLTINGTDYNPENFTDAQKYLYTQFKSLNIKEQNLKFELDTTLAAKEYFAQALQKELGLPLNESSDSTDTETADS